MPVNTKFTIAELRRVYEAVWVDDTMRRLIGEDASEERLAQAAFAGDTRLSASARDAVARGDTTLEEATRVTRMDEAADASV